MSIITEKPRTWLLILSLLLFIITATMDFFTRPSTDTSKYAEKVGDYLHGMESEFDALLKDTELLEHWAYKDPLALEAEMQDQGIYLKPYTIALYKDDSLLFWNNVEIGGDINSPKIIGKNTHSGLLKLPSGYFYVRNDTVPNIGRLFSFFPIKYQYNFESIYLEDVFAVDKYSQVSKNSYIPKEVQVSLEKGSPVTNIKGNTLFKLSISKPIKGLWITYTIFILYLLGGLFGILWLTEFSRHISRKYKPWLGILLLAGSLIFIRFLMVYFGFAETFSKIPFFAVKYSSQYFMDTLGDMLLNATLALWVALFFYREFKVDNLELMSVQKRYVGTFISYTSIIMGILTITYILKGLVLGTDIPFDFENIAKLELGSFLSILGVLFLMMMLFLFTYRISKIIFELKLPMINRFLVLGLSLALVFVLGALLNLGLPLDLLLLFSIIYIVSFDLFVETESTSLTWLVVWLVIYSAFSSVFLYKYNQEKESIKRLEYAIFLTSDRNEEMESSLQYLAESILGDGEIHEVLRQSLDIKEVNETLRRNQMIDLKYIDFVSKLHLYHTDTLGNVIPIEDSRPILMESFAKRDITLEDNLRFRRDKNTLGTYLLKLDFPHMENNGVASIILEFNRSIGDISVTTEIFKNNDYRELEGLSDYNYAVYQNDTLISQEGDSYPDSITVDMVLPDKGKSLFVNIEDKSHLTFYAKNGNIAMLNIDLPDIKRKLGSLFSYLFTIMVVVLSFLMLLNTLLRTIIKGFGDTPTFMPSLKNKIQVSVISVILLSFVVIGIFTIVFFEQKNHEYHAKRFTRKAQSIRGDMDHNILLKDITLETKRKFEEVVKPVSDIHRLDVNIYSLDGQLITSSMQDLFSTGLVSPLMNAHAFHDLAILGNDVVRMQGNRKEKIGKLEYEAQYEKLLDIEGNPIAYLGMPYFDGQSKLQSDTSDFIGTLLNVYVILLLLAGLIAIFIANSITRPLTQIGDKLKDVKIGKKNEPIEWKSKDELGALIGEYNKMIKKLEDSTHLLAQSERESAWREMAKQVAHEIKNPLTPMKLSIQYLQHAYHSNPANMESMLKRVSKTLIEQIDNLAQIATEFSNFAKMPRAENERFAVNDLVQSVFDLFSERDDMTMTIHLTDEKLMIFADKNQLMRVFNNLIKNAIQAIPEDKQGQIDVRLDKKGEDLVELKVMDNGSGITEDMKEFIFVPHITTKSSGTGLGLAISKSIIEALDGNIYFESVPNVGTTFVVELPIYKGEGE